MLAAAGPLMTIAGLRPPANKSGGVVGGMKAGVVVFVTLVR